MEGHSFNGMHSGKCLMCGGMMINGICVACSVAATADPACNARAQQKTIESLQAQLATAQQAAAQEVAEAKEAIQHCKDAPELCRRAVAQRDDARAAAVEMRPLVALLECKCDTASHGGYTCPRCHALSLDCGKDHAGTKADLQAALAALSAAVTALRSADPACVHLNALDVTLQRLSGQGQLNLGA